MALVETRIELRPYEDRDQSEVLELLDASLGGGPVGSRPAEFFRWKHMQNPFGPSYMLVAQSSGRIVGLRAFMRWRFTAGDTTLRAVRAVDTATHPDHQGKGIFSQLTRRALEDLRLDTDLVFNTPNEKSLPGYLKMGWQIVDRVPIYVHVRRPVRFARHAVAWKREIPASATLKSIAGIDANQVLADIAVDDLLRSRVRPEGLSTPRDIRYLRWRYGDAPLLDYRAIVEHSEGSLDGIAFFRVRPRGRSSRRRFPSSSPEPEPEEPRAACSRESPESLPRIT